MASFNIRLRHPLGTSTLTLTPSTTLEELQTLIFSASEIPIEEQELKIGYPPTPLSPTLPPSSPISSIPITRGEQVLVSSVPSTGRSAVRGVIGNGTGVGTGGGAILGSGSGKGRAGEGVSLEAKLGGTPLAQGSNARIPLNAGPSTSNSSSKSTAASTSAPASAPAPQTHQPSSRSPAPAPAPVPTSTTSTSPPKAGITLPLPLNAGILQHQIVPDDNSCLFSAIGVIFRGGGVPSEGVTKELREIVAETIRADEETYPEVVLGRPREEYIQAILKPATWGGAIELSIFARHFKTEIDSFDVLSGRADKFGEGQYGERCLVVYSGIHYDALTSSFQADLPPEFHTTIFPTSDATILPTAAKLVAQLKAQHYYTDTANFDLRCGVCGVGLKGEKGAREHAMA